MTNPQPNPPAADPAAEFVRLLGENEKRLGAYVFSLVPHWADAEDITQQVRIKLWEQFGEFDRSRDFGSWACTIAYYEVLTHRRQDGRRATLLDEQQLEAVSQQLAAQPQQFDQRSGILQECMKKLTGKARRLVDLFYGGECTLKEVAEQDGWTYPSARSALHRARISLADCIERSLEREDRDE